jgi:Ca2+:H+ antiporter
MGCTPLTELEDTMNLAIGVVVGSGTQIPLLVLPCLVIFGWLAHIPMTLVLGGLESLLLFLSVSVLNYHVRDGGNTYVAGTILLAT